MKRCIRCGKEKPLDMFYRNCDRKDGRLERCKACVQEYERSSSGVARRKKWQRSNKGQLARVRNKPTPEHARELTQKYRETDKGKKTDTKYHARYKGKHPKRIQAGTAVMHAIQSGKIVKPSTCEICGCEHYYIHGHHKSYEPEHWLDVVWVCPSCHKKIHNATPLSSLVRLEYT